MNQHDRADGFAGTWIGEVIPAGSELEVVPLFEGRGSRRQVLRGTEPSAEPGAIALATGTDLEAEVRVVRVLAEAGSARAEIYRLAARFGLVPFYPEAVLAEAAAFTESPGTDVTNLEDLEHLPFVTIDNEDSRDLDQALFIRLDGTAYVVYYALADASFYVRNGSALFSEALARGSSYYLPGLTLPMLPRALSEDLISLNQGQLRRALVSIMTLDECGKCRGTRLVRARIRSRRKLSYNRVQRSWDDPSGSGFGGEPYSDSLGLLREVGHLRINEARRRHVVDHHRVELDVRAPMRGCFEVTARDRLEVERCNEQISLLCNIEGAKSLVDGRGLEHVQPIFRVHPAPTVEAVAHFERLTVALARVHGASASVWAWSAASQTLDEFLEGLPRRARPRLAAAIERQAIQMNRRSVFDVEPGEHHGIGASVYARFSSPMREIVGIFTHKEAFELINGPDSASPTDEDVRLRDQVVVAGNRSKGLQRTLEKEVMQLVLDELFAAEIEVEAAARPVHTGTVIGIKPHLVYVRLDQPPVEVKMHLKDLERLTGAKWRVDREGVQAIAAADSGLSPIQVGSVVMLRVAGYSAKRRRWLLTPA